MTATSLGLIGAALVLAGVFLNPRLLRSQRWQAVVTPLASIIGSGFLVVGPILAAAAGTQAWLAMTGLCGLGYLFGAAIRHNIQHVEPLLASQPPVITALLERVSDVVLAFAYFISVAYYINLFAAFGLRLTGVNDVFWIRSIATGVLGGIGILGLCGGLDALERLALGAVGLKLSLIGAVLVVLAATTASDLTQGGVTWPVLDHPRGYRELSVLLGLIVLVQGFETSRYLGEAYDWKTRVTTMRQAQWISTAIYIVFIVLITRYFTDTPPQNGEETVIIDMLRPLGLVVGPMIILAALASQLSAAVADTNGAGGLLSESLGKRLSSNVGHLITALAAISIVWVANIYEIITYASKAFVAYYALQSIQAARSAWLQRNFVRTLLFVLATALALVVIVFAIPADA
ncbi:hypothetical protein G3T14_22500 [Methylobacterium sp. BTF04]|uniref:hypothetical protein n=1 Tax=Methylobacterium sp. BTF04 TaxID=2708300 RepID=UPI0013CF96F5|nr:hypothetical protein [Methylobacterium sp. BTF04]NEU14839.1 hypothetical protein [Methylobacterium sp. BTF04]